MTKITIYGTRPVSVGKKTSRYIGRTEDNTFVSVMLPTVADPKEYLGQELNIYDYPYSPAEDRHIRLVSDPATLKESHGTAPRAATASAMLAQLSPNSSYEEFADESFEI